MSKKNNIRLGIFILIAAIITSATFYIERQTSLSFSSIKSDTSSATIIEGTLELLKSSAPANEWQKTSTEKSLGSGDHLRTAANSRAELKISQNSYLRLDQNTEVVILGKNKENQLIQLIAGRIWVNNQFADPQKIINIQSPGVVLIPQSASVLVENQTETLNVTTHSGSTKLALIPLDAKPKFYNDPTDQTFLNSFLVIANYQTTIFRNKITEQLKPLLYSKIVKEFNYGRLDPTTTANDSWIEWNIAQDQQLQIDLISREIETKQKRGLQNQNSNIEDSITEQAEEIFTLSPQKLIEKKINRAFIELEDAEYLLVTNEPGVAQIRFNLFLQQISQISSNPAAKPLLEKRLTAELTRLLPIPPGHVLYKSKQTVLSIYFSLSLKNDSPIPSANIIRLQLQEGIKSIPINSQRAYEVLGIYHSNLLEFKNHYATKLIAISDLLEEENQILGQAIGQYPELFNLSIFDIKTTLENTWLDTLPVGPDLREEKQTLILDKTRLLEKLRAFFFEEKITVSNAKDVVPRIIQEIEKYQDERSQIAIQEIFAERLQDFEQFLRYLNSPEYSSESARRTYGTTHKERYQKFLDALAENKEISALEGSILGSDIKPPKTETPEEIITKAISTLQNSGLENIQLEPINSTSEQAIVIKSASIKGQLIQAEYDWRREIIKNIYYKNKTITLSGVKADKFTTFIEAFEKSEQEGSKINIDEFTTDENETESKLERTAKILIKQKLSESQINAPLDSIKIIDLEAAKFQIERITIPAKEKATISFDFQSRNNEITNFSITTEIGSVELPGPINLTTQSLTEIIDNEAQKIREKKIAEQEILDSLQNPSSTPTESSRSDYDASLLEALTTSIAEQPKPETIDADREAAKAIINEITTGGIGTSLPSDF